MSIQKRRNSKAEEEDRIKLREAAKDWALALDLF